MEEEKCAQCGAFASPNAQYCVACGAAFSQSVPADQPAEDAFVHASQAGTITIDVSTGQVSTSAFFGALIFIDVIIAFLYFTLLEGRSGQTVGKMIVKIKVTKKADYSPISYSEAAVRTILRIIDLIPFIAPYLLGAALIWASEHNQRLGDRVANTVVVQS